MTVEIVAAGAFFLGFCLGAGAVIRQVRSGRVVAGGRVYRCMDTGPVVMAPIEPYEGLKCKYIVYKSNTGEPVENCFVLRPDKDPAAVAALRAYARATDNGVLAADIIKWVEPEREDKL